MTTTFPNLRSYIERLRREDDLVTVEVPVDAHLEAAEIHRRVIAAGGPAILFTNISGADLPLVTNLFGTRRRAEMAFGERPFRVVRRLAELAEEIFPPKPSNLWQARDIGLDLLRVGTKRPSKGPRQRGGDCRCRSGQTAGADLLARGWGSVHHPAAGLYRASAGEGAQSGDLSSAGP